MSCVKTAISIDAGLFAEIQRVSDSLHISRSGFFDQAARLMLEKKKNLELLKRFNAAAALDTSGDAEKPSSRTVRKYYGRKVVERW